MENIISWQYWFNLQPEPLLALPWKLFIALIVFMFLAAIVLAILKMRPGIYRGFFKRLYVFALANSLIGSMFLFFNYEQIPFFSARFWLLLWLLSSLTWLYFPIKKFGSITPNNQELKKEKERLKYLP